MNEPDRNARFQRISGLQFLIFTQTRSAQKLIASFFLLDLASISLGYFIWLVSIPPLNDYLRVTGQLPITLLMLCNAAFISVHLNHPDSCEGSEVLAKGWMWARCLLTFVELSGCVTAAIMMDKLALGAIGCVLLTVYTYIVHKINSAILIPIILNIQFYQKEVKRALKSLESPKLLEFGDLSELELN